jgi:multisubunit Na+/H+ antiporter MnhF subunit
VSFVTGASARLEAVMPTVLYVILGFIASVVLLKVLEVAPFG